MSLLTLVVNLNLLYPGDELKYINVHKESNCLSVIKYI